MRTATRLDTQTADDVRIAGGHISGVTISGAAGEFTYIYIGDYRLYVADDGSLVVAAPDGAVTPIVFSRKGPKKPVPKD